MRACVNSFLARLSMQKRHEIPASLCHERDAPNASEFVESGTPFGLPGPGAGAAHALAFPGSGASVLGQAAGPVRPLAAGLHDDSDRSFRGDLALHADEAARP